MGESAADAKERLSQQQRIQLLQERLELYNSPARHADLAPTSSQGTQSSRVKPSRTAPVFESASTAASASLYSPAAARGAQPSAAHVGAPRQKNDGIGVTVEEKVKAATATSGDTAAAQRISHSLPSPQSPPSSSTATGPAPPLARSLAQELAGSAGSPGPGSLVGSSHPPTATATIHGKASPPVAPAQAPRETPLPTTTTSADEQPRRASNVFHFWEREESDEQYVACDVEEEEEEEEEESEEDVMGEEAVPSIDDLLRRIFHSHSGLPTPSQQAAAVGAARAASEETLPSGNFSSAQRLPTFTSPIRHAAMKVSPQPADGLEMLNSSPSKNFLIQRAVELYQQRRLNQQHPLEANRKPLHTDDESELAEESSSLAASTSEPFSGTEDRSSDIDDTTSGTSGVADGVSACPSSSAAPLTDIGAADLILNSEAPTTASVKRDGADGVPSSALCFNQLEMAYRRLLILQRGSDYVMQRAGLLHFPEKLPHETEARGLAEQRDLIYRRDVSMRANPPAGTSLEDVRSSEYTAVEATLKRLKEKFDSAMRSLKVVADREALLEGKKRLLKQREADLAKQREARLLVEHEVAAEQQRLAERKEQLRQREEAHNAQLQRHDREQQEAQGQIEEVEQLSKQVSLWLTILEERDRRLIGKEKRLQRVQVDLVKRSDDVSAWKKALQRIKQTPPPPSPPRIS